MLAVQVMTSLEGSGTIIRMASGISMLIDSWVSSATVSWVSVGNHTLTPALVLYYWRASEASKTLSGVYKFELVWYIYIYIYVCMEVHMP